MSSYARAYVCITYEKNKRKIPLGTSRGLKWENKTYKLKRSIGMTTCERFDAESTHADELYKYTGSCNVDNGDKL